MTNFADIIKPSPSAKFQILETPVALPGKCIVCGAGKDDGRKYVDFGLNLDWYGAVYFCGHCFNECAYYLGWLNPAKHEEFLVLLEGLRDELALIKAENVKYRNVLDALGFLYPAIPGSNLDDDSDSEGTKQESSAGDGNVKGSVISDETDESESFRPSNERGSKNVQHPKSGDKGDEFILDLE